MKDVFDKLADDIKASTKETCAKVAEIHLIKGPVENDFQRGFDAAAREIADRIRRL